MALHLGGGLADAAPPPGVGVGLACTGAVGTAGTWVGAPGGAVWTAGACVGAPGGAAGAGWVGGGVDRRTSTFAAPGRFAPSRNNNTASRIKTTSPSPMPAPIIMLRRRTAAAFPLPGLIFT